MDTTFSYEYRASDPRAPVRLLELVWSLAVHQYWDSPDHEEIVNHASSDIGPSVFVGPFAKD